MKDRGHALPFSEALFETQHFVLENSYFLGNMNELSVTIAYREMYAVQEAGIGHFLNTFRCKSDATSSFEFRKDDCRERSSASVELASFSLRSEGKLGTTGRMIELMGTYKYLDQSLQHRAACSLQHGGPLLSVSLFVRTRLFLVRWRGQRCVDRVGLLAPTVLCLWESAMISTHNALTCAV